jgi:hypothetical protein
MQTSVLVFIIIFAFGGGVIAMYLATRTERKPARKKRTPWLTANQLGVLDVIRQHGRRGLLLWHTDINLATIRSLSKHGFCDTASHGRIVITRAGRKRLLESSDGEQPTGDQKNRAEADGLAPGENDPTGSQEGSEYAD